jgi:hypothetical protein
VARLAADNLRTFERSKIRIGGIRTIWRCRTRADIGTT